MAVKRRDSKEDREIQREIKARATYSVLVLERTIKMNGSGSDINLLPSTRIIS